MGESMYEICRNAYGDRLTRRSALTFYSIGAGGWLDRPSGQRRKG